MSLLARTTVFVHRAACVRCASCSSLAPALFAVDAGGSRVVRQPASEAEWRDAEAAVVNCPTRAIGTRPEEHDGRDEP